MSSSFSRRHLGPSDTETLAMLGALNFSSLDHLTDEALPKSIRSKSKLDIGPGLSEAEFLNNAREIAKKNKLFKSYIGLGYYNTFTPSVIQRNIFENPGWYTAYTPYQAEISQGRMEALLNFQTMISDLTGLPIANASLLDEATAAAEAMSMCFHSQKKSAKVRILVDENIFPQTKEILTTRANPIGIEITFANIETTPLSEEYFAVYVQFPTATGDVKNYKDLFAEAKSLGIQTIVGADILSLTCLEAPGTWGAQVVIGSTQRLGVPMGYGGPHAAFMATEESYARLIPGRIIGLSKDRHGNPALRLALQTREQHIRREKATSNICTAQVLLAVMASMYTIYHGPEGLKKIAERIHSQASYLRSKLEELGYSTLHQWIFDTIAIRTKSPKEADELVKYFVEQEINLGRYSDDVVLVALDETTNDGDLYLLCETFAKFRKKSVKVDTSNIKTHFQEELVRKTTYLTHPTFQKYRSETELLRYIHRLEQKDLALNQSMIPLGSCTMKLNATTEMIPVSWPEFGSLHPFVPMDQAQGYLEMIRQLENWLMQITGFAGVSLQPNAGSQGEYAGLLVIRAYLKAQKQSHRNICLIPTSAHGTNPASAVMAGFKVVPVACDQNGNVDVSDLKSKSELYSKDLAALMITYPSTHGVFEDSIREICEVIHTNGGQVYMDGANFNALVGLSKPGDFGADVCHLNLHKTFCIPHGGGGPGIGPIGVATHLKDFLPRHNLVSVCGPKNGINAVSAAPWGSASILPISWAYMMMMGSDGLKKSSQVAILNANYIAYRLSAHYPILYRGKGGFVAHECIIDVRQLKESSGVSVDDIAKRLMDFGFHAPTMSWPVAGTLMIEPTESESKEEIDRFCDAMIRIREEIREIEAGKADRESNVLKNAPHTVYVTTSDHWTYSYGREKASFPLPWVRERKFWPSVGRVDNVYGDKNLVCSCPPMDAYKSPDEKV